MGWIDVAQNVAQNLDNLFGTDNQWQQIVQEALGTVPQQEQTQAEETPQYAPEPSYQQTDFSEVSSGQEQDNNLASAAKKYQDIDISAPGVSDKNQNWFEMLLDPIIRGTAEEAYANDQQQTDTNNQEQAVELNPDVNTSKEYLSHDFDWLNDWGGAIGGLSSNPMVGATLGTGLSLLGSIGNSVGSKYEDPENSYSRAADVVNDKEYIADPNAIAMPEAAEFASDFTDEARQKVLDDNWNTINAFLINALGGAGLQRLGSSLASPARLEAQESRELADLAKSDLDDLQMQAGENIQKAMTDPERLAKAREAFDPNTYTGMKGLPEDVQNFITETALRNPDSQLASTAAGASRAGWENALYNVEKKSADRFERAAQTALNDAEQMEKLGKIAGQTGVVVPQALANILNPNEIGGIPAILPGGSTEQPKQETGGGNTTQVNPLAQFSDEDLANMTQRQMFERLMENEAARQWYGEGGLGGYGERYGDRLLGPRGYEEFRDLGDSLDYSDKYNLVRDLWGYNPDAPGIKEWQNLAANANLIGATDDETINNIMNYMWSPENIINVNKYLNDNNYAASKTLGNPDSSYWYAMYLQDKYGDKLHPYNSNLDAYDFAEYVMGTDLVNRMNREGNKYNFGDSDMGLVNWLMEQSGDTGGFGFMDDGSMYSDHEWRIPESGSRYNPGDLWQAANSGALESLPDEMWQQMGYYGPGVSSGLVDKDLADLVMSSIQKHTGRKVGRKAGD